MSGLSRRRFLAGGVTAGGLALLGGACKPLFRSPGGGGAASRGGPSGGVGGAAVGSPEDPFGYQAAFERELARIGQISPAELAARHPAPAYLAAPSFDPTAAAYFADFQRRPEFQLSEPELGLFQRNGFVVSGRLAAPTFAELYYRVFTADLPVLITADSLLHAWHRSYDAILEELEASYLYASVDEILSGMADALPKAHADLSSGPLAKSVEDADTFLAVGRSLLAGKSVKSRLGRADARVDETLAAVNSLSMMDFELFGSARTVDFSQFKVRGHYEKTEQLKRYFRAMMWLGRIDLRVVGHEGEDTRRQLGGAIVLHHLLMRSGRFDQWGDLDRLLQTFVGRTDSMTFAQLGGVLAAGGIASPAAVTDLDVLTRLQDQIAKGTLGFQGIRSDYFESSPLGGDQVVLPRSFTVMGQKFVVDSWATAKVVADDILWDGAKVQRRMPSALDVSYAVLGNDHAVPLLVRRIGDPGGVAFRDGLPYQHNLAAVRAVMDSHPPAAWEENLYMGWLGTLRALSAPTTDARFPEAMRTEAWAMKTLNTQLGSWAQLRHDTILYVKQSYTAGVTCFHPAGFVEPRVEFWKTFVAMARRAQKLIDGTPYPDRTIGGVRIRDLQARHVAFFGHFADRIDALRAIAEKQLARAQLDAAEARMLRDVVQISHMSGSTDYSGWYPTLFYAGPEDCGKDDALVADVHTDVPAPMLGDPGGVLHQGVGAVDMMMIAVDCDADRIVYVGPTFSHYELATSGVTRLSDSDWKQLLAEGKAPPRPEWTRSYLADR